ncbi:MAG: hypothetical protein A2636_05295 [Elusimicrobia bacterium RIFCSPHIGHO2_01_FULL_64_10]|nr:MAG: hypothetical protein A2636_05295 [Elusimicrobia bacterium RIFCSPHIGHO2_01_FULL_64_10]
MSELEKQIETAYDYRGHVTVKFMDGSTVEGFLFNRQFSGAKQAEAPYVEMFLKGNGERRKFPIAGIESVGLSGPDCAADPPPPSVSLQI